MGFKDNMDIINYNDLWDVDNGAVLFVITLNSDEDGGMNLGVNINATIDINEQEYTEIVDLSKKILDILDKSKHR